MNPHTIFYYPYCAFRDGDAPLLKAVALYFDKLYVLDPEKASGGTIGTGAAAKDVKLLEEKPHCILERVAPEDVLKEYEADIETAVRADMEDEEFLDICERFCGAPLWQLALAKIPAAIRNAPEYQPLDRPMQRLMRDTARDLTRGLEYREGYGEAIYEALYSLDAAPSAYLETGANIIEYRYADYPLPLGESIMVNHALFAGLRHSGATPLTDDPFHGRVLEHKIKRARELPQMRDMMADRANERRLRGDLLAMAALRDTQLDLPAMSTKLPLEEILEYRDDRGDELREAREKLGWLARQIEATPWSEEFADEVERKTIPEIREKLRESEKARNDWLKSRRKRLILQSIGLTASAAANTVSLVLSPTPLLPVAVVVSALGLVGSAAIPALQVVEDLRTGNKAGTENGLHYLLKF